MRCQAGKLFHQNGEEMWAVKCSKSVTFCLGNSDVMLLQKLCHNLLEEIELELTFSGVWGAAGGEWWAEHGRYTVAQHSGKLRHLQLFHSHRSQAEICGNNEFWLVIKNTSPLVSFSFRFGGNRAYIKRFFSWFLYTIVDIYHALTLNENAMMIFMSLLIIIKVKIQFSLSLSEEAWNVLTSKRFLTIST